MDIVRMTITEARRLLDEKQISSVELTKKCLAQIAKYDRQIHAFITVCKELALKTAERADRRIAQGERLPLLGIPYSMKDVFITSGIPTTAGSQVLKNYIPTYDATVYSRLQLQGAVLLGKTNCDAWGHGSSTENSDFGPTKNPWNIQYVPGGSSGGSAAAVALGMGLFSIGEDTGGSIRQPASFCNMTGLKVSYGRVSRYGAIAYASSLDSVGPMAKNVLDCETVLSAIAGKDLLDASSIPDNFVARRNTPSLQGITIGIPIEFFSHGIDLQVKRIVMEAAVKYKSLGADIIEVSIPTTPYAVAVYYLIAPSETSSNLSRYDGVRYGDYRQVFSQEAKRRIMIGTYALSQGYYDQYYLKAQKVRTLLRQDFEKTFTKVDALLAPVSPTPPFQLGEKTDDPMSMYLADAYTVSINPAGIPSLALPAGFTNDGLPVGMQLVGPQQSEAMLFGLGKIYQQATQWHTMHPKL